VVDTLPRLTTALAHRYRIERELGRGGMATVYLALDLKHDRQVAIKVLRTELASALGPSRFLREVEIAAKLSHPHILPLYDSGDADGTLFYVMPYIKGESLRQKLTRERELPVNEAIAITRQVAAALGHAHAQHVVHRDVKPENILLHEGEAMVTDFGIALATTAEEGKRFTETGLVIGTPEYMSPEQAMSERVLDARSDVYSLACVLYEMLAGEPPYMGANPRALLAKQLVDPVPGVRRLRPAVPVAMEQALKIALSQAPADRFASAAAFVEALTAPGPARAPAVAVLPFVSLSADPENEHFANGLTEDVIAHLSKIHSLKVISRSSVMPFKTRTQGLKEIAAILGADTVLEGSVRKAGDRVRIVAQLIDAETDQHLWAETYDRRLTDIFVIQTDVALHIAAALKAELSADEQTRIRKEQTRDIKAYQLYVQGRHLLVKYTLPAMKRAIMYFERAIAEDPTYALAYASVAMVYAEFGEGATQPSADSYARAWAAAEHALALDPALGEAHCALARLHYLHFDWTSAEREFQRALELSPGSADTYDLYGRMYAALGRYDEAIALQERAQELDPLAHRLDVATTQLRAGRYAEAAAGSARALEDDPDLDRGHATLGWARIRMGNVKEGLGALEHAAALTPGNTQWHAQLAQAYAETGWTEKARGVFNHLEELGRHAYVSPYHLAFVYTGLGEHERALDLLEQAFAERSGGVNGIGGSFLLAPLRPYPRFKALLAKMNVS
jgi:serine/threonine protein kinase/tetratricopeptide (TPR) repeat protein